MHFQVKLLKDLGFIPAKAGFKAFVWNDEFYVMGEAGAAFAVTNDYNQTLILAQVLAAMQHTFHCVTSTILILENEQ
jgi:hypothetical protein